MPVEFTPEELVNAYTARQNQCRQEAIGHNLVIAEAQANPDLSKDEKAAVVDESTQALATINIAYDAASALLEQAQADLNDQETEPS